MSTEHILGRYGDIILTATESSCEVSLAMYLQHRGSACYAQVETAYSLTDNDLISLIVELAKVASYIVSDPNSIQGRVIKAMKEAEV